jgi:hypothetical protein
MKHVAPALDRTRGVCRPPLRCAQAIAPGMTRIPTSVRSKTQHDSGCWGAIEHDEAFTARGITEAGIEAHER